MDKGTISYHYNENGNLENGSKELYTYKDKDELTAPNYKSLLLSVIVMWGLK